MTAASAPRSGDLPSRGAIASVVLPGDGADPMFPTWAERVVAACAVASQRGAELARSRVLPEQIWDPHCRRLYIAALDCPEMTLASRIGYVVQTTGLSLREVDEIVEDRGVFADTSGSFASRVVAGARRRELLQLAADVHNRLLEGDNLERVEQLLTRDGSC